MPRNVCPFLENGLLNAVDQPQRIHHELSARCSVFTGTGAMVLESVDIAGAGWLLSPYNLVLNTDFSVGSGPDAQIIAEAPIR